MALFGWTCVAIMVAEAPLVLWLHYRRYPKHGVGFLTWLLLGLWIFSALDDVGCYAYTRWHDLTVTGLALIATLLTTVVVAGISWFVGGFLSPRLKAEMQRIERRKQWHNRYWTSSKK